MNLHQTQKNSFKSNGAVNRHKKVQLLHEKRVQDWESTSKSVLNLSMQYFNKMKNIALDSEEEYESMFMAQTDR